MLFYVCYTCMYPRNHTGLLCVLSSFVHRASFCIHQSVLYISLFHITCVSDFVDVVHSFNLLYGILLEEYTTIYSIQSVGISGSHLFFSVDKERHTTMHIEALVLLAKPGSGSGWINPWAHKLFHPRAPFKPLWKKKKKQRQTSK